MIRSKLFSVKNNWKLFVPYLNDQEIIACLARCLGYEDANEWNQNDHPPWSFTQTDYWLTEIDTRVDNDLQFQSEVSDLEDDEQYFEIHDKYYEKYKPKRGEYDWYQWKHACFFITPFMMELIRTAIPQAHHVRIITSSSHSIVQFILNGQLYYADLLNEWDNVDELEKFMESGDTID